jgi:cytochrome oxidase assembly protein ShyY1
MLLRPGWLAALVAVLLFAGACFWMLSPWQFRRNAERSDSNDAVAVALRNAPVPLEQLLPGDTAPESSQRWRQVTITGTYLPEAEAIARLRTVEGEPAYEVLTPLRTATGIVLIDRGYLRPEEGKPPAYPAPPAGPVTLTARVQPDEQDPKDRPAFTQDGQRQVYAISAHTIGAAAGLTIRPGHFQLLPDQPGVLGITPLPQLDAGPFFSYALQWIAFGLMALGALTYFTWRELKPGGALTSERRRQRKSVAQLLAEDEPQHSANA